MKEHRIKGFICVRDDLDIEYIVASIEQIYYSDDSFKYIFKPYYNIIDLCDASFFQGIPGINLSLKKEHYIRENKTPTFIYERTPQENREDLWEYLDEANMEYLDKLEWLIKTNKKYTGDRLYVKQYQIPTTETSFKDINFKDIFTLDSLNSISKKHHVRVKNILNIITAGAYLNTDELIINDDTRSSNYKLFKYLYRYEFLKQKELDKKKKPRGKKKIEVSIPLLAELVRKIDSNLLTKTEALEITNLSRSTFYRRVKEFREKYLKNNDKI